MKNPIVACSEQLSVLAKALDNHCRAYGISDAAERLEVARQIMSIFGDGIESEAEVRARLARSQFRLAAA